MSKHYEDRGYSKGYSPEYDDDRYRSRHRSTSRSSRGKYYEGSNGYRQRLSRSNSGTSASSASEYEYKGHYTNNERAMVRVPRDVIRAPTPPPVIQRVVERAPTPEPDIVERVIVRPQPQQLIERIIERPRTPPPKIIDKEISEPAPPPIVRTRIVKVDHSPRHYQNSIPYNLQKQQKIDLYQGSGLQSSTLGTYGTYHDAGSNYIDAGYYNYAPTVDRSFSTTLSAAEVYPPNIYTTSIQPQQQPQQSYQTNQVYATTQNYPLMSNYQTSQMPQTYNSYPYAHYGQYGYRPLTTATNNQQIMYNQPAYPTQYMRPAYQQQQQQPQAHPVMGLQGF